jgi:hypothetical protein
MDNLRERFRLRPRAEGSQRPAFPVPALAGLGDPLAECQPVTPGICTTKSRRPHGWSVRPVTTGAKIAWTVHGQLDLGHVYGYRLEPIEEGTLVTSYYDWSAAGQSWKDAAIFPVIPQSALRATLGILARTVAPGKPRPAPSTP